MGSRLVVRRRRDGLIQLRRRRIWHVLSTRETTAIFMLFLACFGMSVVLITVLLAPPVVLGALPLVSVAAIAVWAVRATQAPTLVSAPLDSPPTPPRNAS